MDLHKTTVASQASQKMQWASERQKLIAQNIANADTPGYRAQDLTPFSELLSGATQVQPLRTHPNHLGGTSSSGNFPLARSGDAWGDSISANNVILEEQMVKAAETKGDYDMAANLYQKSMNLMSAAIGRE